MNLLSLTLRNFKSYGSESQTINLHDINAIAICGDNGTGKSSLIDALTFSLYGRAAPTEIKELGLESLINDNVDEAYVSIIFEKDKIKYTLERTIKRRGKPEVRLTSENFPKPIVDVIPVTEKIQTILGMDYETFISSTIIRQDEMNRLSAKRPAERKEILAKIFNLQLYESLREKTRVKKGTIEEEVTALKTEQRITTEKISKSKEIRKEKQAIEKQIHTLQRELDDKESSLQEMNRQLEQMEEKKSLYNKKIIEQKNTTNLLSTFMEEIERRTNQYRARLSTLISEIGEAKKADEQLKQVNSNLKHSISLKKKRGKLLNEKDTINSQIAALKQKLEDLTKRKNEEKKNSEKIAQQGEAACPLCKRPLDMKHRDNLLKRYQENQIKLEIQTTKLNQELTILQKQNSKVMLDLNKLEHSLTKLVELHSLKGKLEEKIISIPKLEEEKEKIEKENVFLNKKASTKITSLQKNIKQTKKILNELESSLYEYNSMRQIRSDLEKIIRTMTGSMARLRTLAESRAEKLKEIVEDRNRLTRVKKELNERSSLLSSYKILERAFHKDGIPTAILIELIPEIEEEASHILRDLSNGRMDLRFTFGRKTRSGKITEELIIEVVDIEQNQSNPIQRYSGGERMRINLALRLGVSEVIAKRGGFKGRMETLIIDEGFGALDEQGRKNMIDILRKLTIRFKKVIVISHIEEVKEAFEDKLLITKEVSWSKITIF